MSRTDGSLGKPLFSNFIPCFSEWGFTGQNEHPFIFIPNKTIVGLNEPQVLRWIAIPILWLDLCILS